MIRCCKCGELKVESEFYYKGQHRCKECIKAYSKKWAEQNKDKVRLYGRKCYQKNKESRSKQQKEYRQTLTIEKKKEYLEYIRRWQKNHPEKVAEYKKRRKPKNIKYNSHWYKMHPIGYKAKKILIEAIKSGVIIKPPNCEICNRNHTRIYGHHPDYSKPLEVIWVCGSCHRLIHTGRINKELTTKI